MKDKIIKFIVSKVKEQNQHIEQNEREIEF
jgi:hypothetical protein